MRWAAATTSGPSSCLGDGECLVVAPWCRAHDGASRNPGPHVDEQRPDPLIELDRDGVDLFGEEPARLGRCRHGVVRGDVGDLVESPIAQLGMTVAHGAFADGDLGGVDVPAGPGEPDDPGDDCQPSQRRDGDRRRPPTSALGGRVLSDGDGAGCAGEPSDLGDRVEHEQHTADDDERFDQTEWIDDGGDAEGAGNHDAHDDTDACAAGRNAARRTRAARSAIAAGAPESQASIIVSPKTANSTTPHHIGRTTTPHDAWATAPPSVSASSRRMMNPPMIEQDAEHARSPHQRTSHRCGRTPAGPGERNGGGEADQREHRQEPRQDTHGTGDGDRRVGERLVADRRQRDRYVRRHGGTLRSDDGERAGDNRTGVGEAQGDRIGVALGEDPVGRLDRRPSRTGQEVTAGDPRRDRLDERTDRHEVGILANELVGDRRTELGGDRIVAPDLVDVVGERRAVEHFAVEVSGEQPEGGEDGAEDDQRIRTTIGRSHRVSGRLQADTSECQLRCEDAAAKRVRQHETASVAGERN